VDEELDSALSAVPEVTPVTHYFDEIHAAADAARSYRPDIIIVELTDDVQSLGSLTDELSAASPESSIVAVFQPEQLPETVAESTVMIQALRLGVEDFIRRPISSRDLEQLLARRLQRRDRAPQDIGRTIAFISNKGGVGKSTSAVNVAVALAEKHPERVLLVDGSLQMGVCAAQLNLQPRTTIVDAWHERDRLDELLLRELTVGHSCGLDLLAAPRTAIDAVGIDDAIMSRILMLARRSYDYVIIDTFPLFDRVVMAILDLCDVAYIVLENVVPTMQSIRGFFDLLEDVEYPETKQRVLLNRFTRSGSNPGVTEVESYLNRAVDHVIPLDRKVVQAVNTGQPIVLDAGRFSKSARAVRKIALEIEELSASTAESNPLPERNETVANRPETELGVQSGERGQ
jgi:pilus assembly protein CpaE